MKRLILITSVFFTVITSYAGNSTQTRPYYRSDLSSKEQYAEPNSYLSYLSQINSQVSIKLTSINDGKLELVHTGLPLDLALSQPDHYFALQGMHNSNYFFTRYGRFSINGDGIIVNYNMLYVLGYDPYNNYNTDRPIQLPSPWLEPKATTYVEIEANLKHNAGELTVSHRLYDYVGRELSLRLHFIQTNINTYEVVITNKMTNERYTSGEIKFNGKGKYASSKNLDHVVIPSPDGTSDPVIFEYHLNKMTNYESNTVINSIFQDGYPHGYFESFSIKNDGDFQVHYSNYVVVSIARLYLVTLDKRELELYTPFKRVWFNPALRHTLPMNDSDCYIFPGYINKEELY